MVPTIGRHEYALCRPLEMFWNRLEVESIVVKDAIKLDSNHLLVVYRQEEGQIERRIVQGPVVFVPTAHEWYEPLPQIHMYIIFAC